MKILLERFNHLLVIHHKEADPLQYLLTEELSYDKRVTLQGANRAIARNRGKSVVQSEHVECWHIDRHGRIVTYFGYFERVLKIFNQYGVEYKFVDTSPESTRLALVPNWENVEKYIQLRPDQREALELIEKCDRSRLTCPTGWGKSYMLAALFLLYPHATGDIVVPGIQLLTQLVLDLRKYLPRVGMVGGGHHDRGDITVVSADSLAKRAGDVDILVVDECHASGTPKRIAELCRYKSPKAIGLSASNDMRVDKADFELEGLLGPVRLEVGYQDAVDIGAVVPLQVAWIRGADKVHCPPGVDEEQILGGPDHVFERFAVWRNQQRNQRIAKAASRIDESLQMLISVKTMEHAFFLQQYLPGFEIAYAPKSSDKEIREKISNWESLAGLQLERYVPMTVDRLATIKNAFQAGDLRGVIATSVFNVGVNFKQLAVLMRADAAATPIVNTQLPGRLSRLFSGENGLEKVSGLLIDCEDKGVKRLYGRTMRRQKDYEGHGWPQLRWSAVATMLASPKGA